MSIRDQTSHSHHQRNHRDPVLRGHVHLGEFPPTVAPMVELGLTVPCRHLQHQLLHHQDHAPSEEFHLTAVQTVELDQIVKFPVGRPKGHLPLQPLVPMEVFLHIAAPMEVKAQIVWYHRDLPLHLDVQMEEILHTAAQMEDRARIAQYQQDLLLVQRHQVVLMVEFHHTVVPMEDLDPIVHYHHLRHHIRQHQDPVRLEECHHTVVQMEELVQTVPFHHHLHLIRQLLGHVPLGEFHHTAALMEEQVQIALFQHKVQRRPDLVLTEAFHHIVVPTEELAQIAMSQHPLYHHQHDHHHHHQEVITNISHPVHMVLKAQNAFCLLLHHRPDHQAGQLKAHPRHLLHVLMAAFLHTAVPMEDKDPTVLSLHDLLQDQQLQLVALMAVFHRIAVPMVEMVLIA